MFRVFINDIIFLVYFQLPGIACVGFLDVDQVESRFAPVLLIELVQRGNLPAKRRSGVASEYQHNGLFPSEG